MKAIKKIFQVQGNAKAHYINAKSKREAIKIGKKIFPTENIDFAVDFTEKFSEKELKILPEYVISI